MATKALVLFISGWFAFFSPNPSDTCLNSDANTQSSYSIFVYNETENDIEVNRTNRLKPGEHFFKDVRTFEVLDISVGVRLRITAQGEVEVIDDKNQVSGIGGLYLDKYGVPKTADFAFVIVAPGEGDK